MKRFIPYSLLAAAAACGIALGQAYTTPVGYITHEIAGTTTAGTSSADTYITPTLIHAAVFAATSTSSPSDGATITFSSGVPDDLDGGYVLEISSGAQEGWWSTVVASTGTSITVNDNFPSGLGANVSISVRPHATLKSFLGDNEPGLVEFDGVNPNDEIQVLDPSTQATTSFAYVPASLTGGATGAYLNLGTGNVDDDFVLEPGYAIKIKRIGESDLTFVSVGEVKVTSTQVDIYTDFNWVGTHLGAGGTLNDNALDSQLNPFTGAPEYDEIQIITPSQEALPYAAADLGGGDTQILDLAAGVLDNNVPFPEGSGIIIRRLGSLPSIITMPGSNVQD